VTKTAPDRKPVVMIAEQNPDLVWLYRRWLEDSGYRVRNVDDGVWALALMVPDPPDMVLLEIQDPPEESIYVCTQLKVGPTTTPIPFIAMINPLASDLKDRILGCGAAGVLVKPFSRTELINQVIRFLGPGDELEELDLTIRTLEQRLWTRRSN
jgi:Response regulator containing a CheY-like receiver domain and an HD-GYP domain